MWSAKMPLTPPAAAPMSCPAPTRPAPAPRPPHFPHSPPPPSCACAAQTAAPFAGRKAAGAYCRHSCYSGPGVTSCKGAVETKTKVLTLSKIPFKVEGSVSGQARASRARGRRPPPADCAVPLSAPRTNGQALPAADLPPRGSPQRPQDCTTEKTTGCAVLMLQSWPSKADHDKFQVGTRQHRPPQRGPAPAPRAAPPLPRQRCPVAHLCGANLPPCAPPPPFTP
jgi:hypothetical protein